MSAGVPGDSARHTLCIGGDVATRVGLMATGRDETPAAGRRRDENQRVGPVQVRTPTRCSIPKE